MLFSRQQRTSRSRPNWRALLVCLTILCVVGSLAGRACHEVPRLHRAVVIKARLPHGKRLLLERDASLWTPPSLLSLLLPSNPDAHLTVAHEPFVPFHLAADLYNRPPPSC